MINFIINLQNTQVSVLGLIVQEYKGPVKVIKRVEIAHSFLQSVSNQFYVIILSLPVLFYKWLSKNFSKPTSKNG